MDRAPNPRPLRGGDSRPSHLSGTTASGARVAALFSRFANTAVRLGLILGGLVALGIPVALMGWVRTPFVTGKENPVQQPVLFDHRHHVVDDGIDCRYCHSTVDRSPTAGIPSTARCMGCHNQIWNSSPLLARVRNSYFSGKPIPWVRVHRLPEFVYFDHSIHVAKGIGCESCHGRVDQMAAVHQVAPLTMGWCLDCHRNPEPYLRPRSQITAMGWRPPGGQEAMGRELRRAYGVQVRTYCTTCHR